MTLAPIGYVLQGGSEAAPTAVLLAAALLLLAAVLPSGRPWTFRRRQLIQQLDLS
jgi:hypothetical protein